VAHHSRADHTSAEPAGLTSDTPRAFFARRQGLLLDQIAAVLGKPIQSKSVASPVAEDVAYAEDDTDDLDDL
jgi:hypothetical protein